MQAIYWEQMLLPVNKKHPIKPLLQFCFEIGLVFIVAFIFSFQTAIWFLMLIFGIWVNNWGIMLKFDTIFCSCSIIDLGVYRQLGCWLKHDSFCFGFLLLIWWWRYFMIYTLVLTCEIDFCSSFGVSLAWNKSCNWLVNYSCIGVPVNAAENTSIT